MKTAEEFKNDYDILDYDEYVFSGVNEKELSQMLIDFAKMHVEAALKAASENAIKIQNPDNRKYVSKKAIIGSYPIRKHKINNNMKFNKELIDKLRNGEICIDYTNRNNLQLLRNILKEAFPEDKGAIPLGISNYYSANFSSKQRWTITRKGKPIPIEQFIVEEKLPDSLFSKIDSLGLTEEEKKYLEKHLPKPKVKKEITVEGFANVYPNEWVACYTNKERALNGVDRNILHTAIPAKITYIIEE